MRYELFFVGSPRLIFVNGFIYLLSNVFVNFDVMQNK